MQKCLTQHLSPKTIMKTIILFFLASSIGCNMQGQDSGLPNQRPSDLKLYFHFDGGMVYHFEDITISADSCLLMINDHGKKLEKRFKLTSKEMDDLYAILTKNRFGHIRHRTESGVYDRGGESIQLEWDKGQQRIGVSNAQTSFVEKGWAKEWNTITDYVLNLVKTH